MNPIDIDPSKQVATKDIDHSEGSYSSYSRKGKGVMTHPCSSKEPDSKKLNSQSRRSISFNQKDIGPSDYKKDYGECPESILLDNISRTVGVGLGERLQTMGLWEPYNERGDSEGFPPPHRFNEYDYERILDIHDSINPHNDASARLINGLPQSTVESENFDETCAVCLDTPTIGDTIRHLPCLHKFHKDCVDMWLNRKASCPICKSSVA